VLLLQAGELVPEVCHRKLLDLEILEIGPVLLALALEGTEQEQLLLEIRVLGPQLFLEVHNLLPVALLLFQEGLLFLAVRFAERGLRAKLRMELLVKQLLLATILVDDRELVAQLLCLHQESLVLFLQRDDFVDIQRAAALQFLAHRLCLPLHFLVVRLSDPDLLL